MKLVTRWSNQTPNSRVNQDAPYGIMNTSQNFERILMSIDSNLSTLLVDKDGTILFVNDRCCELFGHEKNDLIDESFHPLIAEANVGTLIGEVWQKVQTGQSWHGTVKCLHKNGDSFTLNSITVPLFYPGENDPVEFFSIGSVKAIPETPFLSL